MYFCFSSKLIMQILNLNSGLPNKNGGSLTAEEISGQPKLWNKLSENFFNVSNEIEIFLQDAY